MYTWLGYMSSNDHNNTKTPLHTTSTIMKMLHMNQGSDEASYANNSSVQENIISMGQPILYEAVLNLIQSVRGKSDDVSTSLGLADLGCSSGHNSMKAMSEIVNMLTLFSHTSLQLQICLNDLPSNDFNTLFSLLPEFYTKFKNRASLFVSAVPGSFYGRLFPCRSMHFIHSSSSLHWLSQAPNGLETKDGKQLNKGKIYVSETSPNSVMEAYLVQFQDDFKLFLQSRAEELVPGGCMVLSFMGRISSEPTTMEATCQWELLAKALMSMASSGLIVEEKINTFNAPYYAPSLHELQLVIKNEGSFDISRMETLDIYWDTTNYISSNSANPMTMNKLFNDNLKSEKFVIGQQVAKAHRAVVESMFKSHFELKDEVMDELFRRYGEIVGQHLLKYETKNVDLVLSLIRKDLSK